MNAPVRNTVSAAAARALQEAGGNVVDAAQALEATVRNNEDLRDALTAPLISNACYDAVRAVSRIERRGAWKPSAEDTRNGASRARKLAIGNLLSFPLPGGKPLGNANREEIAEAANFYSAQSRNMGVKAAWLRLVLQSVPSGKIARQVLTEDRLRELQEEATHAEAA